METQSVRCNHCGAPLEVGESTRFVTCQFCNSQLEIKRTESAVFTEVAVIARQTERMANNLEIIKLQNELEQLDREWELHQQSFQSRDGNQRQPSTAASAFGMVFAVFFALVCFGMASVSGFSGFGIFTLVPIGMGIFAIVGSAIGFAKAGQHRTAMNDYQLRRGALLRKLDGMNHGG